MRRWVFCLPCGVTDVRVLISAKLRVPRQLLSCPCAATPAPTIPSSSRKGGHLTERAVNGMVKRTAKRAGTNEAISPHWLRQAHAFLPSTAAPRCPRCSRRWATATSLQHQGNCTPGLHVERPTLGAWPPSTCPACFLTRRK